MDQKANLRMISRLLFRLLPVQILLAAAVSVNGLVSGYLQAIISALPP